MGLNRFLLVGVFSFLVLETFAQVGENRYLVYFADKAGTPFSVDQPEAFLSERAIVRRMNQNIPITEEDLPVNPENLQNLTQLGDVEVIYTLKWFNAALIETEDPDVITEILGLDDVTAVEVSPVIADDGGVEVFSDKVSFPKNDFAYGPSFNQIDMLNGVPLHEAGFTGEGIWIGVFDGGFSFAQQAGALQDFVNSDRLLGAKDFIDGDDNVFERSTHGSYVLSTMTGFLEDSLIGTAPGASYLLCITEDVIVERRIEEANWAAAAEYADSVGVDIINTSLGYTTFDVGDENHTYETLDGNTTLITRASNKAASKGILTVTSAGNSGNNPWFYIGAPADGDNVLAVGAVTPEAVSASLSSRGPRVDGAIKPNVVAQGQATVVSNLGNGIRTANGTSFSSPIIAGMAASLWQAVPEATAQELFEAIEESAHLYENPNDSLGYGIPDFALALSNLQMLTSTRDLEPVGADVSVFPNPQGAGDMLNFVLRNDFDSRITLELYEITGKKVLEKSITTIDGRGRVQSMPILAQGIYLLNFADENGRSVTSKLVIR